jgi:membrane protein
MTHDSSRFERLRATLRDLLEESLFLRGVKASRWHGFVHFWILVWRSFVRNRCPIRASALAYATLLALIPMLAVVVSISSSFLKQEGEERIDQFIMKFVASVIPPSAITNNAAADADMFWEFDMPGQTNLVAASPAAVDGSVGISTNAANLETGSSPELPAFVKDRQAVAARKAIARTIHQFIQNTQSGALGVTGSVLLIFAAISMLSRIETTFNDIWGVARGRSWFMRIVLYWGVLSLAPMLLIVAFGLATGPHLESTRKLISTLPFVGTFFLNIGFQMLPVVVLCFAFAAFYMLIPNTKVHWGAALAGGLAGGLLLHANNVVSVLYVSRVVSNSKIYGSLGLVPVFMIGLYFSWLILLFGAQVAYAYQNRASYLEERLAEAINQRGREFVALRIMTLVGQRYLHGELPPSVVEMSRSLCVPTRLIQQLMQTLVAARLVVETSGAEGAYLPARPMEAITCHDILLAMRSTNGQELATRDEPTRAGVYGEFQRIQEAEKQAASSVTVLAMAHRAQAQLSDREPGSAPG